MKELKIPFSIGQTVFFKTDEEQKKHIVTGIIIRSTGIVIEVSSNGYEVSAYDFELTTKQNVLVKLGIDEG
ncbi:hypothetical protein FORMB_16990 [Formosa sp. Hel1_33_131]|uniref:hypothetical protein n=1 Tax=Formosa sp. Hel1_33_131 TaxID=1336794 RepID=UPI00084E165F|nr:hypothetical protein [Formosa sp. Hel1_33_131]AOR28738.1 hypothetical protein FORMB_16990 [Formosa sp. Hel1_33_131]